VFVNLPYFLDELHCLAVLAFLQLAGVVDYHGQILGHETFLNSLNHTFLQQFSKVLQELVIIDFGSVEKTTGPGKDTCDGVS
jgi:hypothetical protein